MLRGDDYRVVRSLTKGGMGAVYLAEDRRAFDRLCVIKQMLDYYNPTDPEERQRARERFEEEGRILASLNHPGIPKIYTFLVENGRFYIVMEYIQGENLESFTTHEDENGRIVPGKRLPLEETLRYTIQVCRILEYLHSQSRPVVHQDIKPANMVLESQLGDVRLVDFGTARAQIPLGAQPGKGPDASIYGTDGYAAPEQYKGQVVPRTDVFALAASAYHLLTDDDPTAHPFKWPHLNDLPRELSLALERALRAQPEQRSTASELLQALETMSTPKRTLEAFTFPGGTQIRSVGALPSLSDEHWDAARAFLYEGDFERWLRDINRHDLAIAANDIIHNEKNHDQGLEQFLRRVDPGIPHPKVVGDPPEVNLGSVARESALIRRVTLLNVTRGYTIAKVSASEPWVEVQPPVTHLWAGIPADIGVHVHAEGLPFRSQQRATVTVTTSDGDAVVFPVIAQVSLTREAWRIVRRAIGAALPESWRAFVAGWRLVNRTAQSIRAPFVAHPWLLWLAWLLAGAAIAAALFYLPSNWMQWLLVAGQPLQLPLFRVENIAPLAIIMALGPPVIVSILWLAFLLLVLLGGPVLGAVRGAWKSFFR
ncbi:MAG: serine/threonine-protein kinase [Anaerolineae bacterium]